MDVITITLKKLMLDRLRAHFREHDAFSRTLFMAYHALVLVGCKYVYGGNNPYTGVDCSGFICYLLKVVGIMAPEDDVRAEDLYHLTTTLHGPRTGALVFYGNGDVEHVMMCLDDHFCIGSSTYDPMLLTEPPQSDKFIGVKVLPIKYRTDIIGYTDPETFII